ncbi:hypothetical protein Tco_0805867, partial [Tanacetum coccineum]
NPYTNYELRLVTTLEVTDTFRVSNTLEQLDWSLVGKIQVVAVDRLWEHIPIVELMVVENKRCGKRWIDKV